jgi:hypothetical protein
LLTEEAEPWFDEFEFELELEFEFELFFDEPQPAVRPARATIAAMRTAMRRYLLMSLVTPPSFHPRGGPGSWVVV